MHLDIHTIALDNRTVVRLEGELDAHSAPRVSACFSELADAGVWDTVVDLGRLTFIDSTGLGVLVSAYNAALAHDGSVELVASDPRIVRVLAMTSLDQLFTVHPSLEAAGLES